MGNRHETRRPVATTLVVALLTTQALLLGWECHRNSITWDEVSYLAAGISHWEIGRFDLGRVNPPLVRMTAALPVVLFTNPTTDWSSYPRKEVIRAGHRVGTDFVAANGGAVFWYYTIARWTCIPFVLLGGWVCYTWARHLYGSGAGLLALGLWCFSPLVLAHGQLITPDTGATALGALAGFCFWRWLRSLAADEPPGGAADRPRVGSWKAAGLAGLSLGLAELTKTTWIILFGLWPAMWLFWRLTAPLGRDRQAGSQARSPWSRELLQLALILSLGVYLINMGYGFEGSFRRLGDFRFISHTLAGPQDTRSSFGNRFSESWLGSVPVPLPSNYVQGIDAQKSDFDFKIWSYLRGEWRHGGWWYYYLYAWTIKEPLGTWLLLLLAIGLSCSRWRRKRKRPGAAAGAEQRPPPVSRQQPVTWRDEVVLCLPAVAVLTLVSSQTGFNHHMRYTLPALPFVIIWISKLVFLLSGRHGVAPGASSAARETPPGLRSLGTVTVLRGVAAAAVAWSVTSSLWLYPHTTSYFNELVGGPWGGPKHLLDSNIDWGQDLLHLRRLLDKHPEVGTIGLSYVVPLIDPNIAGIPWEAIPPGPDAREADRWGLPPEEQGPQPGWYAITVCHIHERLKQYRYFLRFEPVATAGYSTYIYHLTPEDVNPVRREYGLPPVSVEAGF